jgi:monoamine oxidase
MAFNEPFWLKKCSSTTVSAAQTTASSDDVVYKHFSELGPIHNMFDSEAGGKPALVGLITGVRAEELESLTEGERREIYIRQLRRLYCDCKHCTLSRQHSVEISTEHEIDPNDEIHKVFEPVLLAEKVWAHEEFSGGCFTAFCRPTAECVFHRYGEDYYRTPEANTLYFACTETTVNFYGYMEGAMQSGETAARDCIKDLLL